MMEKTKMRGVYVYVVEALNGLCKIGHSRCPEQRASMVHKHSATPVRLIAKWLGSASEEAEFHRRFVCHRSHSEWFVIEGDVLDFVNEVRGRNVDVAPWESLAWRPLKEVCRIKRDAKAL